MPKATYYQNPETKLGLKPNISDIIAFIILLGILAALAFSASEMQTPYHLGKPILISLAPTALPGYAANTILRMFIALAFSLLFTFTIAPLAAKNKQAEKLIIPAIDILQSVPILGVLSITIVGFIHLFPNSRLGPECAAIFAIFTSQVWNMTLSFYQSLKTTPKVFYETAAIFHLSAWQQFWRIEVPYAIPGLLWNTMVSMSAGWFFVVASEAISVSNQNIMLPGIGSYIRMAITNADHNAIFYAILTMLFVILLYDQLLFRPLLSWSERFKSSRIEEYHPPRPWFYRLLTKTRVLKSLQRLLRGSTEKFLNSSIPLFPTIHSFSIPQKYTGSLIWLWNIFLIASISISVLFLWNFITHKISFSEIRHVFYLGGITGIKVAVLIILSSVVWVPIGVWVGLHPKMTQVVQPIVQFLAAFPVNLVYPLIVTVIVHYHLSVEIWSSPLMILGTQWYILFNVIAGAAAIPKDLLLATKNFSVGGWLWWKRLAIPAILPYYITGSMTAAGGCWNASIVADVLEWGNHKLISTGLGSYISAYTSTGDFPRIALGIGVMCCYVLLINHFIWRKLYHFSASRFVLE